MHRHADMTVVHNEPFENNKLKVIRMESTSRTIELLFQHEPG
jgi:hypothetical protein